MSNTPAKPETITTAPGVPVYNARERATPLASRGEPMVWLTGGALAVCAILVITLLGMVVIGGSKAFWPRPIETVATIAEDGAPQTPFLGMPIREESYAPPIAEKTAIEAARTAGKLPAGAIDSEGRPVRRLYRIGNKDFGGEPFIWVPLWRITDTRLDPQATLLERQDWGVWLGEPRAIVHQTRTPLTGPAESIVAKEGTGDGRTERTVDGQTLVTTRTWDSSPAAVIAEFQARHTTARALADRITELKTHRIGSLNRAIEAERLAVVAAEIRLARAQRGGGSVLPPSLAGSRTLIASAAALTALLCAVALFFRLRAGAPIEPGFLPPPQPLRTTVSAALLALGIAAATFAWFEGPWRFNSMTLEDLAALRVESASEVERLNTEYAKVKDEVTELEVRDQEWRIIVTDPATGRFSPQRPTEADLPMRLSQVVRAVQPNELGTGGKLAVYGSRWGEFITDQPRDANTEGGIFPVIIGTVTLTILLCIVVVPLGVIAAIYLREYARQGPLTSAIRIAINNLAGVPSIVYGVFGLGFFCYTVGAFVDTGSGVDAATRWSVGPVSGPAVAMWWLGMLALAALVITAVVVGMWAKPAPGKREARRERTLARVAFAMWIVAVCGAVALIASTPYFNGFFEAKSRSGGGPTMATKGLLWSAITLALLTLPVVIVATEEAVAAVPRTMREASLGCGATKWQTIQRVVLPRAMPGIMTGAILAMARGAGEVAPLMLVGAVKVAEATPLDTEPPFLHLERPFMHLGFHIYDVGFQSPDSEAARPLVWCTTLLLILVVVSLNATAIRIRTSLRKKFLGEAF